MRYPLRHATIISIICQMYLTFFAHEIVLVDAV